MGLFSLIGGILGGGKAKKASRQAQQSEIDALNRAIDIQNQQFNITRDDFSPFLASGRNAIGSLADLIGVNGNDAQAAGLVNVQNSPLFQSRIRNSEEALLANASATGGLRGGNIQDALYDNRGDAFATTLEEQMARLAGLAGFGQNAANSVGQFGANRANQVGQFNIGIGDAQSNGILTRGGINAQNFNNIGSFLGQAGSLIGSGGNFGQIASSLLTGGRTF